MKKKTLLVSLDALGESDKEIFEGLDGFSYLIENGAYVERVQSVYPSLTYPCHATIVSGREPRETGIVNNLLLQPSKEDKDWFWYEKYIKGDTIFRAAKRKGLKTGGVLWPVAGAGSIDKLVPEILPQAFLNNQVLAALSAGDPVTLIKAEKDHGGLRHGFSQPQLDDYVEAVFLDLVRDESLDIVCAHFIGVDSMKHDFGPGSKEVEEAIGYYNQRIKNILKTMNEEGIPFNVFFLSDHSHLPVDKGIRLNSFLNDEGYLTIKNDKIFKYKYYMQEAGGAAYIYSNKTTEEMDKKLYNDLVDLGQKEEIFEKVLTRREAKDLGADPECLFMIEAKAGYTFIDGFDGDLIEEKIDLKGNHGYDPRREGYGAVFFALGEDIKNTRIKEANLVDLGPTVDELLDLGLEGASGKALDIFK